DKTVSIDYKEVNRLRRYLSERAKIEPRRKTGTCAEHQRELAVALKRILIVPFLTLVFGFPLLEAVGVSLVCVIMTSGAAAGVYLERRVANLRLGMTLELFTAIGALFGGLIAFLLPERLLEFVFALLLAYTALTMARRRDASEAPADATP